MLPNLDGRIVYTSSGIALDPDYANATGYEEYSYFKPKEAYELKMLGGNLNLTKSKSEEASNSFSVDMKVGT